MSASVYHRSRYAMTSLGTGALNRATAAVTRRLCTMRPSMCSCRWWAALGCAAMPACRRSVCTSELVIVYPHPLSATRKLNGSASPHHGLLPCRPWLDTTARASRESFLHMNVRKVKLFADVAAKRYRTEFYLKRPVDRLGMARYHHEAVV